LQYFQTNSQKNQNSELSNRMFCCSIFKR